MRPYDSEHVTVAGHCARHGQRQRRLLKNGIFRRVLVAAWTILCIGGTAASFADTQDRPPPGHSRALEVPLRKTSTTIGAQAVEPPVIDGRIDDPAWRTAAVTGDFWISDQERPPSEPTEVLVFADERNLYFAFRVYDGRRSDIQAYQTRRNAGLGYDDQVAVELDTYFNRRDISRFSVNAAGVQDDDIAGGRAVKIEWKGDWSAAAMQTDYGWSAEIAIPFVILNYREGDSVFGVNFLRYHNRTREWSRWADVTPRDLPEEMGRLTGLSLTAAASKQPWTLMPYGLIGWNIPDKDGDIRNQLATAGIDIRYQPRPNLTGVLSLNPDFSQVERQITDIDFSYTEKILDEVRPFFQEGSGYFGDPKYFYSVRVPGFDYGGKAFGRIGRARFGTLAVKGPHDRADYALRGLYELGETHSVSGTLVGTDRDALRNTLGAGRFEGRHSFGLYYSVEGATTETKESVGRGSHTIGTLGWKWNYWGIGGEADRYGAAFFPANGLIDKDLPGTQGTKAFAYYYRERADGAWRLLRGDLVFKYRETASGFLQERNWYGGGSIEFHNQIKAGFFYSEGPYRPVTKVPGVFSETVNDDRYSIATLDFNTRSSVFGCGLAYQWGFLGGGDYEYLSAYAWGRPVNTVYLSASAENLDSFGRSEQYVLKGQWDVTKHDSLSTRYIFRDGFDSFRLAYGRRVRKGLDVFAVYNKEPFLETQFSVKLLLTYP